MDNVNFLCGINRKIDQHNLWNLELGHFLKTISLNKKLNMSNNTTILTEKEYQNGFKIFGAMLDLINIFSFQFVFV